MFYAVSSRLHGYNEHVASRAGGEIHIPSPHVTSPPEREKEIVTLKWSWLHMLLETLYVTIRTGRIRNIWLEFLVRHSESWLVSKNRRETQSSVIYSWKHVRHTNKTYSTFIIDVLKNPILKKKSQNSHHGKEFCLHPYTDLGVRMVFISVIWAMESTRKKHGFLHSHAW